MKDFLESPNKLCQLVCFYLVLGYMIQQLTILERQDYPLNTLCWFALLDHIYFDILRYCIELLFQSGFFSLWY